MRRPLTIIACLSFFHAQAAPALLFGDAPRSEAAKAMKDLVVEKYRAEGIAPAIRLLDAEGKAFLKREDATASFDFHDLLRTETKRGEGRDDQEWRIALTEWCYNHCFNVGESYWLTVWTPLMHQRYFEAGRYGAARAVIDRERVRLLETGDQLEVDALETIRPANPEFPAIGLKSLGRRERITAKEFSFFMSHAEQDLVEGKWRRAMEASVLAAKDQMGNLKWHQQRPNLTDSKLMVRDLTGKWRQTQYNLAEGYRFLGLYEPELNTLRELGKFNIEEQYGMNLVLEGKCRALHIEYILGQKGTGVLGEMVKMREELASNPNVPKDDPELITLQIADIHFREGNAKRGWELFAEIRAKQGLTNDMRYKVDAEWCRHRVDTGEYGEVEGVLIKLLETAREGGLKQREIALYETYAKLLIGLGRYEDALVIQRELIRLLRSFDLFPRVPGALQQVAVIQALMGERDLAAAALREANRLLSEAKLPEASRKRLRAELGTPLPDAMGKQKPSTAGSDLQPLRSLMIPLDGMPARGLFTLTNHSGQGVSGELHFQGPGLSFRNDGGEGMVGLEVSGPGGNSGLSRKVTIPAGEFVTIDLSRNTGAESATVRIEWRPEDGETQEAEWIAEPAEEGVSIAVTDAAEYLDNPFYLIPIYHLLQYKDTFAQAADVRVVASAPARIELYDLNDELVFVDADGDGAFTSQGDIVSKDLNRNGAGDLVLVPETQETRFRLFVRPAGVIPGGELSLDLQLFQQGEWITHSTDRLLFPDRED